MFAVVTKRILFLTTSLKIGGAETQVKHLACAFSRRGFRVCVVSMLEPSAYTRELKACDIEVHSMNLTKGRATPSALFALAKIINRFNPDVVHSHMIHANLLARATRAICKIDRLVCTAHGEIEGGPALMALYRLSDGLDDVFTHVSKRGIERFEEAGAVARKRMLHIDNALDFTKQERCLTKANIEFSKAGENFIWLAAGRLCEAKDFETLIDAMAAHQNAHLFIAGEGEKRGALEARIARHGLQERVHLLGLREDLAALMRCANAFVLSSKNEGLPMVLLEAARARLPALVTNVGDARVLADARFVVPKQNAKALAKKMQEMATLSEKERRALGEAAYAKARDRFSLSKIVSLWETIYENA